MTSIDPERVREIAERLTYEERVAFVAGRWGRASIAERLISLDLATRLPRYMVELTPLGLAVRDLLRDREGGRS